MQRDSDVATVPRLLSQVARVRRGSGTHDVATALAVRLMEGVVDVEVKAWLRSAFVRWRREGGDLVAHLRLPTARRFRLACRDLWLRDAARYCVGKPWPRTRQLEGEIARFMAYRWLAWQRQHEVPPGARPLEVCLFLAAHAHPELPRSTRALYRVIADAFSEDDDTTSKAT